MFDKSKIGHSFPLFTAEVYRNKIHELALAVGDTNPVYHSREAAQAADYDDVPLFPTTATMFSFWSNPQRNSELAKIGINVMRILHGEEEYEYLASIHPGDVLTGVTTIVDGKSRKGKNGSLMDIVTTETRYTNQHNQPVLNARTTLVVRE
ncbi:MAG: MaoC family dehydratase N-terminal domain-containing protein [Chloroflexi bacterium]|nr:MaoC family dehydratase N-terminal domain-containing protein [Ktedonobacteraceae bacterium]MBV9019558.1 MaoC family dehydratase N-terminal domain-containing protein [Ktedonobacteraceae bacterium]MBV9706562.1 MaoC family dehydratase N-terminal domain-containing protein [Chloroflexota bacterium]